MPTLSTVDATLIDFRDSGAGRPYVFMHGWTAVLDRAGVVSADTRRLST